MTEHCEFLYPEIIEYQIDNNGYVEKSYRPTNKKVTASLNRLLQAGVKVAITDIELIGYHDRDNISYQHSCDTFTISGYQHHPDLSLMDFYAIKLYNKQVNYKFYRVYEDRDFEFIQDLIDQFDIAWPAIEFGVGFYPTNLDLCDYYFYIHTKYVDQLYNKLNMTSPQVPQNVIGAEIAHMGVTVRCGDIVKLKRYCHGLDPLLQHWTGINGAEKTISLYKDTPYYRYLNYDTHMSKI